MDKRRVDPVKVRKPTSRERGGRREERREERRGWIGEGEGRKGGGG